MKDLTDIISRCLRSERKSQQVLYDYTYQNLITAVALYTKDQTQRDWVFNLGMYKVFTSLEKFTLGTNYLGWARTILVRSTIDHLRKNKTYKDQMAPANFEINDVNLSSLNDALDKLATESLIQLIQSIPENERMIFTMYEIDGYTHSEISELTGINKNTSKWLLAKARKSLKNNMTRFFHLKFNEYGK